MLHAIHHKKTKYYARYHGDRSDSMGELRVAEEDEITSTVFGPLDFMPTDEIWLFWQALLEKAGKREDMPDGSPITSELTLWPKRGIEPDGMATLTWEYGKRRILLLEIKWHACLHEQQLEKQWSEFLKEDERKDAYHIFIAPNISQGIAIRDQNTLWGKNNECLILLSWLEIRNIFDQIKAGNGGSGLKKWAQFADVFLEKIGVYRFEGFCNLGEVCFDEPIVPAAALFWKPFKGFAQLSLPSFDLGDNQEILFFNYNPSIN